MPLPTTPHKNPTTNDQPVIRQLDTRLSHIYQWIIDSHKCLSDGGVSGYTQIWDLCCDHGRLGMHLHQSQPLANTHIHLVDCVPSIVDKLHQDYAFWADQRLHLKLADAATLEISCQGQQAIVIAGVGGETLTHILQALLANGLNPCGGDNLQKEQEAAGGLSQQPFIDFFLSPNSHGFELRQFLIANHFRLIDEAFITAKGFHHEHLHLRLGVSTLSPINSAQDPRNPTALIPLTEAGLKLWQPLTPQKIKHLKKLLKHHQLCYRFKHNPQDLKAVNAYREILDSQSG